MFAVVLTLELATRFFHPDRLYEVQFDPDIGYLLKPNLSITVTDRESNETYDLRTNSLGFRGSEWIVPKPQGVKRIAILGDSFVEGRAYPEDRVFCGRLQKLLNESSTSERWEVMNLGVGGQNTSTQLAVYQKIVKPLDPDLVILCVTLSNDIRENFRELAHTDGVSCELEQDGRLNFTPPRRMADLEIKSQSKLYLWQKAKMQFAVDRCRSWISAADLYDPLAKIKRNQLEETRRLTAVPLEDRYQRAWSVTGKILELFQTQVEETGSRFYVVSLPNAWQIHPNLFDSVQSEQRDPEALALDQPIEQLAAIADRLGLELLELTPAFREDLADFQRSAPGQSVEERLFLKGIGHYSERAHQLIGEEVFRFLNSSEESSTTIRSDRLAEQPTDSPTLRR
ncbi:MAG TPA: SGNH/GDSL hydrolase family protein [Planctomycetaceae bacterium]|nr:SGNH/GDSL hydrolase family protein [Planctomycetaceae bacterium]